ncbi:hypothetical protein Mgra_00006275 [Meloidogyne graminicola]|uniref:Uncharacterized protein n=1 Tax=Meloidogyne graminicola TaxID=189291 RepID=A0A8S9ZLL6_9BILA|nr:hypothetical protein Mgra_00006275 [Meloidogyne graminicola]
MKKEEQNIHHINLTQNKPKPLFAMGESKRKIYLCHCATWKGVENENNLSEQWREGHRLIYDQRMVVK